jgi:nitrogen-specific signal transduction histidine kinase
METAQTMFAPAERASLESVFGDTEILKSNSWESVVLHEMPHIMVVLNKQRQIVYKNRLLMDFVGTTSDKDILGKRLGELLQCVHSTTSSGGCGTTEHCRECGAVGAMMTTLEEKEKAEEECRIVTDAGYSFDFKVWTFPLTLDGRDYLVLSAEDIRHEKRRFALERTFFHDVLNIAGGLVGVSDIIDTSTVSGSTHELLDMLKMASNELVAEINGHRMLLAAEDGNLEIELEDSVNSLTFIDELTQIASRVWPKKAKVEQGHCEDFHFKTDRTLLFRVLYNMIKNAVEASSPDQTVSIRCFIDDSKGVFSVHNQEYMSRSTQLQMFQRSFSTKGKGRGIGTYSMKLFGEEYLKGDVWFTSSEENGTNFQISIPSTPF